MPTPERQAKINRVASQRQEGILVLEDIHDPHNAMAVFRSCDAFAFQKVYLIFEKEKKFKPKKIGKQSSSSANKWLDFEIFDSTEKCLSKLKSEGFTTYATALTDKSTNIHETEFNKSKTALMLGNEHRGLSDKALEMADNTIIVPMSGMVQSLNLSVTAAICLYEINRQRRLAGIENFYISASEQDVLAQDFAAR